METTLNIHMDILKKINASAHLMGISRSQIIILLIKKVMSDIPDPGRMGKLIQYQENSRPDKWHTFHISYRMDDYEYFLDLKKLCKMSLSLILAYAVKKYLSRNNGIKTTDNYLYKNYVIIKEFIDDIICWRFIWGYPPTIGKLIT